MLITPRPGTNREGLLENLHKITIEAGNISGDNAYKALLDYLEWVSDAVYLLGNQISGADLERLVLTPRYGQLLGGVGTMTSSETEVQRVVNSLVSLEKRERIDALTAAMETLRRQISEWSQPGIFVVPDTSFYVRHDKLEEADFAPLVKVWEDPIHVLVPIVVVDELDSLKQSKDDKLRWRAGYTLAVFDRLFKSTTTAELRPEDFSAIGTGGLPRGRVTIQLLFDPPGHVRLPINDDEIVDRAVAVQTIADRPVTLLTYDTGQSMRARVAGLKEHKLTTPAGPEPKAK